MSGFLHNEDNLILLYEDERGLLEDELQVEDDLQIDQSNDSSWTFDQQKVQEDFLDFDSNLEEVKKLFQQQQSIEVNNNYKFRQPISHREQY